MSTSTQPDAREDSPLLILVAGIFMIFLGTCAVVLTASLAWWLSLALAVVFAVLARPMRPSPAARSLRLMPALLAVMASSPWASAPSSENHEGPGERSGALPCTQDGARGGS